MTTLCTEGRGRPMPAPYRLPLRRATVRRMTPSDAETLLTFLYGPAWRGPFSDDSRMRSDNVKRLVSGRRAIPPTVAEFLLRRVADRWLLRGWAEERPPAGLSPAIAAELARRVEAARRSAETVQPSES